MTIEILVSPDVVLIEQQVVRRPDYISRSDWAHFWQRREDEEVECCGGCETPTWIG